MPKIGVLIAMISSFEPPREGQMSSTEYIGAIAFLGIVVLGLFALILSLHATVLPYYPITIFNKPEMWLSLVIAVRLKVDN